MISFDQNKITASLLAILTIIAIGMVLQVAQSVFIPLVIAWLLSYILGPVVNVMTRRRIPTGIAVFVVLLLVFGVCYLAGIFFHQRFMAFVNAYPRYAERLNDLLLKLSQDWNYNPLKEFNWVQQGGAFLLSMSQPVLSFLSKLIMVIIFLVFLLLGKPYFHYKVRKAFSQSNAEHLTQIINTIATQIGQYLGIQFLISLATGVLIWAALSIIGVDFAITWGALAFFLNFIPTIGSIVASIPPILLALIQFHPSLMKFVLTILAILAIQVIMGNILTPKVMGDRLNLSPVVVLVSLLFWGWLWGVVGALLSVPIAAMIKIVCENIEPLQPISILMGSGKSFRKEFRTSGPPGGSP